MGSRTKNTPSKSSTSKKIKELEARLDAYETNFFHSAIRTESALNILIKNEILKAEEFQEEMQRLAQIALNISPEQQLADQEQPLKDDIKIDSVV